MIFFSPLLSNSIFAQDPSSSGQTKYNMPDYSAKEYLEMASGKYEDLKVRHVTFLGKKYEVLDIPAEQTNVGRRTQFAIKEEGIIIVITFTMDEDVLLEDAVGLLTPLYY